MNADQAREYFDGFSWAVPMAFGEALAACRFEQGDTLYNTRKAYGGPWSEALPRIQQSIQVQSPARGPNTKTEKDEASLFADNWNAAVVFRLTDYRGGGTRNVTTTQGRLYSLLWKGTLGYVDADCQPPPVPTSAMQILSGLPKVLGYVRKNVLATPQGGVVFLMPFDTTNRLLTAKFRKTGNALARFRPEVRLISPAEAGLQSEAEFVPTVRAACFAIQEGRIDLVEQSLKEALYVPTKNRKTEREMFRIGAHGHLAAN